MFFYIFFQIYTIIQTSLYRSIWTHYPYTMWSLFCMSIWCINKLSYILYSICISSFSHHNNYYIRLFRPITCCIWSQQVWIYEIPILLLVQSIVPGILFVYQVGRGHLGSMIIQALDHQTFYPEFQGPSPALTVMMMATVPLWSGT